MKACVQNLFLVLACVGMLPMSAAAQAFTNLYTFTNSTPWPDYINNDGVYPNGGLVLLGNTLYGTAKYGGTHGNGTIFKINTDGTGFKDLYDFSAFGSGQTNIDGANPNGGLILSGNTLYGTTSAGGCALAGVQAGIAGKGTVFKMNVSGGGFATLHYFSGNGIDGDTPRAGLVLQGNILYGTTEKGGTNTFVGNGTVYKINADGTGGFNTLHDFNPDNSEGYNLEAGLVLSGNTLYGTAAEGGNFGSGTVFKVNTDGTGFSILHNFAIADDDGLGDVTNSDGGYPKGNLVISGNTVYGTASVGGTNGNGTVFKVNADNTGFALLHEFAEWTGNDGVNPNGGLLLSGNTLYGTANDGGSGNGTVFAIYTNGLGYQIRYDFTAGDPFNNYTNGDGVFPNGGLILLSNTLYGTASEGGYSGNGTVFSLSLNNLAVNGGFENFSDGWTLSGAIGGAFAEIAPHSGNGDMLLATTDPADFGYLSQTLDTIPGQNYSLSFWLYVYSDTYNSPLPDEFLVNWGGNTISDQTNLTSASWGYLQFNVTATAPTTVLQFGFRSATYFGLDDVSVVAIPPTKPILFPISHGNGQFSLMLNGITGTNYIVEMNTNISGNNWISISTNTATGGTFNFTDTHATNASRYYRVVQQ
jgi:uncharacterized repeat protein (TIGR03803 family)